MWFSIRWFVGATIDFDLFFIDFFELKWRDLSTCSDKKCSTERKNFLLEKKRLSLFFFWDVKIFSVKNDDAWTILRSQIFHWASNFFCFIRIADEKTSIDLFTWPERFMSIEREFLICKQMFEWAKFSEEKITSIKRFLHHRKQKWLLLEENSTWDCSLFDSDKNWWKWKSLVGF